MLTAAAVLEMQAGAKGLTSHAQHLVYTCAQWQVIVQGSAPVPPCAKGLGLVSNGETSALSFSLSRELSFSPSHSSGAVVTLADGWTQLGPWLRGWGRPSRLVSWLTLGLRAGPWLSPEELCSADWCHEKVSRKFPLCLSGPLWKFPV